MRRCKCCGQLVDLTLSERRLVNMLKTETLTKEEFTRRLWPTAARNGVDLTARAHSLFFSVKRKAQANGITVLGSGKGGRGNKGEFSIRETSSEEE